MTKIFIITAVIDLDEPDEPKEQTHVPEPKPVPPDSLLKILINEIDKVHNNSRSGNHTDWKNINGTFFKG